MTQLGWQSVLQFSELKSNEIQAAVATMIGNFSTNAIIRDLVVKEGGVKRLIEMFQTDNRLVKRAVITAIANIALGTDLVQDIVNDGVLKLVSEASKMTDHEVLIGVSATLANLANIEEIQKKSYRGRISR